MKLQLRNTVHRYGWIARVLHWTTVTLVAAMFIDISGLDVPPKNLNPDPIVARHVSFGLVVLALMAIRLAWRLANPNPVRSYRLSRSHLYAALVVHGTLYVMVFALCASGIASVIGAGRPLVLFGHTVSGVSDANAMAWQSGALGWHESAATMMLLLVVVHVTAALFNQAFAGNQPGAREP